MTKARKPIPAPITFGNNDIGTAYPIPFSIAERPRMVLNFLALHSGIPQRYREVIAILLQQYNDVLGDYMTETYGHAGANEANLIAQAMAEGFLESIRDERESQDAALFKLLDGEIFGNT